MILEPFLEPTRRDDLSDLSFYFLRICRGPGRARSPQGPQRAQGPRRAPTRAQGGHHIGRGGVAARVQIRMMMMMLTIIDDEDDADHDHEYW